MRRKTRRTIDALRAEVAALTRACCSDRCGDSCLSSVLQAETDSTTTRSDRDGKRGLGNNAGRTNDHDAATTASSDLRREDS